MSYKRRSPIPIVEGGTGDQSLTSYAVLCGGTTTTGAIQSIAGVGTLGQVLTSNGAAALPTFQAGGINTLAGDTGSATGSTVTLSGGLNITTAGASSTVTIDLDSTISIDNLILPDTTTAGATGTIQFGSAIYFHNFGVNSVFIGNNAGTLTNTTSNNVGIGTNVLENVTSNNNIGVGNNSLSGLTSGSENIAIGSVCMDGTSAATNNIAIGNSTLQNGTGAYSQNVAIGQQVLQNLDSGAQNIAIGVFAGSNYTTSETQNICIGSSGVAAESNTLRIGDSVTRAFIGGIFGVTVGVGGIPAVVDNAGQLGTVVSSARYKENIEDMGDFSSSIYKLRPVLFNYKSDPTQKVQPGLIAEEVAQSMPELAVIVDNQPLTVRYEQLCTYLLNEVKKLEARVRILEGN